MPDDRENSGGGYSLEDILAEYKSSAYIAGEKKLPVREMRRMADNIIAGGDAETVSAPPEMEKARAKTEEAPERPPENAEDTEEAEEAVTEKRPRFRIFRGGKSGTAEQETEQAEREEREAPESGNLEYELPEDEPSFRDCSRAYGSKSGSLRLRALAAGLVCLLSVYLTAAAMWGIPAPGVLRAARGFASAQLIFLLLASVCGSDVLITGVKDALSLKAGAETLMTFSALGALFDAVYMVITGDAAYGLPCASLFCCGMFFVLRGAYKTSEAYRLSFRAAASSSSPYVLTLESERVEGGDVVLKSRGTTAGFFTKSGEESTAERACTKAAPVLMAMAFGLSLVASVGEHRAGAFFRCFGALSAAAAPFSLILVFGHPFRTLASRLYGAGAAVAGWRGATDLGTAAGMVINDGDLYPPGTASIATVNIVEGVWREQVVACAGSLIMMSGSCLAPVFAEFMKSQRCLTQGVEDFAAYEGGGLGASINGEKVLVGSSGFMNLMGIRIPESLNIRNAVFCAINGGLAGTFVINYAPTKWVRTALTALLGRRLTPLFAVRDFNITTTMLRQRFKLPAEQAERMDVLSCAERYRLSEPPERERRPSAVLCREGLGPYAQAVLGSRYLLTAVRIGMVLTLISAFAGVLLLFFIFMRGAFTAASVGNILIYMLAWLVPVYLLAGTINKY